MASLTEPAAALATAQNRATFVTLLNELIHETKAADTRHPAGYCTLCAVHAEKLNNAPSLDIFGSNAYGYFGGVAPKLCSAEWTKPILFTEYGPNG